MARRNMKLRPNRRRGRRGQEAQSRPGWRLVPACLRPRARMEHGHRPAASWSSYGLRGAWVGPGYH